MWNMIIEQKWGGSPTHDTIFQAAGVGAASVSDMISPAQALRDAFNSVQWDTVKVTAVRASKFGVPRTSYNPTNFRRMPFGSLGQRPMPLGALDREKVWKLNREVTAGNQGFVNLRGVLAEIDRQITPDGNDQFEGGSTAAPGESLLDAFVDPLANYIWDQNGALPSIYFCMISRPKIGVNASGGAIYGAPIIRPIIGFSVNGISSRNLTRKSVDQAGIDVGDEMGGTDEYQPGPPVIIT